VSDTAPGPDPATADDAPPPKMVAFRLPSSLVDELKHAAWFHRTTQTEIVTEALREYLTRLPQDGN